MRSSEGYEFSECGISSPPSTRPFNTAKARFPEIGVILPISKTADDTPALTAFLAANFPDR